jgi:hypothetical protein
MATQRNKKQETLHVGERHYAVFLYIMQDGSKAPFPVSDEEEYKIETAWAKKCVVDPRSYVKSYRIV